MSVVRTECSDGGFTWVALVAPTPDEVAAAEDETGLHGLTPESTETMGHGPRLDPDASTHRSVLKAMTWAGPARDGVTIAKVKVVVADGVVVTSQATTVPDIHVVRDRLADDDRLGRRGPVAVLSLVAEVVIDSYEPMLEDVADQVEAAEAAVFSEARTPRAAQTLYALKKVVLDMRRVVTPVANVLEDLAATEGDGVPHELRPRVRYLADRARHAAAEVEANSELLSDALQANLAQQGNQQNDDMRLISAWAAVAAVPTLLAGIWGMNFRHMPELDWTVGYPLALALIVGASAALALFFRRRGWI